jgi:hypothetical protein
MVKAAVEFFNRSGVKAVFHCGDIISPFVLPKFRELDCKEFFAVFGNNDGEKAGLAKIAAENGWVIGNQPLRAHFGGKNFAVVHEPAWIDLLLLEEGIDIILYGHTHKPAMEKSRGKILINPGEAGGWLYGKSTVALLDLGTLSVEFHVIRVETPQPL